jgi:acetyl esterase
MQVMADRSHWDPEMAAFTAEQEKAAAAHPPVKVELPLAPHRRVNDLLGRRTAVGGPEMAETTDRWVNETGRRIFCRVFRPVTDRVIPTLVYFHGGGWVWANVDTHDRMTREYAAAGQVAVVSVDYALSPEAKFPQALLECAAVVRFVAEHGADWGLDPTRIFVGGDSAGGNLALATALLLRDTAGPPLQGILANYPVSDARFDTQSYQAYGAGGYGLNTERMAFYWSVYVPHEIDRLHPLAAPLRADLAGLPPVIVLLAELDVLRSEGEALVAKLRAAGVHVETKTFTGTVHGFLRATGSVQKARDAVAMAGDWMHRLGSKNVASR